MREIGFEEAKKIELDILLEIVHYCDSHGLKYYLAYGTLIGAIRHKGFIPWDDDIDIHMTRSDYNNLIENYNKDNPGGRYRVISPYDPDSKHSFVKVIDTRTVKIEPHINYNGRYLGVDIDIFPLDGEPYDDVEYDRWYSKLHNAYRMYGFCLVEAKGSWKRRLILPMLKILLRDKTRMLKKAEKLHAMYPYEESSIIGSIDSAYNIKNDRFPKEWFGEGVDVEFEGCIFKAPHEYALVLKQIYGDYMQLPPEEKRTTHHINKMYWKE